MIFKILKELRAFIV